MKKTLYLLGLLLAGGPALAQKLSQPVVGSYMAVKEFKLLLNQPLLVVLPEALPANAPPMLGLRTPAQRQAYNQNAAAAQAAWAAAATFWRLSPSITIIKEEALAGLVADKQQAHVVLNLAPESLKLYHMGKLERETMEAKGASLRNALKPAGSVGPMGMNRLSGTPGLPPGMREAAHQSLYCYPNDYWFQTYHPSDLITTVQQLQAYVQQCAEGKDEEEIARAAEARISQGAAVLRSKTLLLDRAQLAPKLTEAAIAAAYPFPVLVTDRAAIETAVAAADPRYLYLHYVAVSSAASLTTGVKQAYQVVDVANGQAVSYATFRQKDETLAGTVQDKLLKELVKQTGASSQ
ncbi:hypothetical protein [Hymenobacter cheonanensis]|uniref:hypothetical protein n=1 Tax=Hymenobacter sp. CA2-7 TaxID=3063993 RepID=UPI00271359D6|nr:hypothetical protein [Hymenobacter sp. CA2-7]MDO7886883.1 hypothetical protein [Hymenobacter sp. CA2-7]